MAEQNILREADNQVVIEGTLLEVRHSEWNSKEGLNIELDIEVAENEVHTVHGMTRYKKKDGSDNAIAKGYQTIIDEYLTVAKHGRDQADKVRVTQGRIGVNEYYGQDKQLKTFPQINTNFVNRVGDGDAFNPRAEFEVEVFVKSVVPEIKNDDETGRVKVNAIIPVFGGKVIPFEFMVSAEGAEFVSDNYEIGCTTRVYGDIVNFKEIKETEVAVAFGKPQKKITTKTVREYLITGGTDPYEEENVNVFTIESIQQAMVEREVYLQELQNRQSQNKQEEKKGGFGSTKGTKDDKPKKPVLPF
jgi:hypothetical protein